MSLKLRFTLKSSHCYQTLILSTLIFLSINLTGCAQHHSRSATTPQGAKHLPIPAIEKTEIIPTPEKTPYYKQCQDEIIRLKKLLVEKEQLIQTLNAREQNQALILQETASEASRAKSRRHRLATQPEAASKIAETEIAIDALKQLNHTESNIVSLQKMARQLLDVATAAYNLKDYSSTMDYATQSETLINTITNITKEPQGNTISVLRTPIPLLTTRTSDLYDAANNKTNTVLAINTVLTAVAYQNGWFQVQTKEGQNGWIQVSQVKIYIANPDSQKLNINNHQSESPSSTTLASTSCAPT